MHRRVTYDGPSSLAGSYPLATHATFRARRAAIVTRELHWTAWAACIALIAVVVLFRAYLLRTVMAHVDSDQAVLGLMAIHIQNGDRPIFFYSQDYMGSLEAYLAAVIFQVWGASEWTVRLPALAFSVIFVVAVYWLGVRLYGRWIGFLSGLFLALGPSILITWSTAAGAGYIEAMVCGALLFLLALYYPDLRTMPLPAALACGLLAGLGIWMEPLIVEYLGPLGLFFALRLLVTRREPPSLGWAGLVRSLAAIATGTIVGSAPLLIYNLHNGAATLFALSSNLREGDHLAVAWGLLTESLPILLGLVLPASVAADFYYMVARHPIQDLAGIAAGAFILGRLIFDPNCLLLRLRALVRGRPPESPSLVSPDDDDLRTATAAQVNAAWPSPGEGLLALFGICCILFFLFTRYGATSWATHLPRYLIPLYTITPLVLGCFIPRRPSLMDRCIATLVIGLLIVVGMSTTLSAQPRPPITGLTNLLESQGVRIAYGTYWMSYRITFLTHQRVLGIALADGNLRLGNNRIRAYLQLARCASPGELAWVFDGHSEAEQEFSALLRRQNVGVQTANVDGEVVYYAFTVPLRAPLPLPLPLSALSVDRNHSAPA